MTTYEFAEFMHKAATFYPSMGDLPEGMFALWQGKLDAYPLPRALAGLAAYAARHKTAPSLEDLVRAMGAGREFERPPTCPHQWEDVVGAQICRLCGRHAVEYCGCARCQCARDGHPGSVVRGDWRECGACQSVIREPQRTVVVGHNGWQERRA